MDNKKNNAPEQDAANEQDVTSDVRPEDMVAGSRDEDPVTRAYARTGRADTTGTNGIPASDEDAGEERRKLYERGAEIVSRID
jgi:hypothetical protein